jgi:hypothetical protein
MQYASLTTPHTDVTGVQSRARTAGHDSVTSSDHRPDLADALRDLGSALVELSPDVYKRLSSDQRRALWTALTGFAADLAAADIALRVPR